MEVIVLSYCCSKCHTTNLSYDEVNFFCGENLVHDEEHGGSGDIDTIVCNVCQEEREYTI